MPELTKIRIRAAKPRDRGLFKKLWKAFLEEECKGGGIILPTEENLEVSAVLFDSYMDGSFDGVVLFVADKAVLMWGDPGWTFETSLGKAALFWGIYVDPEYREKDIANELTKAAVDKLKALGFNNLYAEFRKENEQRSMKAVENVLDVKNLSIMVSASLDGDK